MLHPNPKYQWSNVGYTEVNAKKHSLPSTIATWMSSFLMKISIWATKLINSETFRLQRLKP